MPWTTTVEPSFFTIFVFPVSVLVNLVFLSSVLDNCPSCKALSLDTSARSAIAASISCLILRDGVSSSSSGAAGSLPAAFSESLGRL